MKAWLGAVSKEHVLRGVAGGYAQVCHGKGASLRKMSKGDILIYYWPTATFGGKDKLQAFTAIGVVRDSRVYQFDMSSDFKPFRCDVDFRPCKEVPISELKFALHITQGSWGAKLRRGHFELPMEDCHKIPSAMRVLLVD